MIYTPDTKKAIKLCFEAHRNQTDKSGLPYVFHPFHVAEQMPDEETTIVALLHDVIEDTAYTIDDLRKMGFSEEVLDALDLMTHDKNVPYMEYVAKISENEIARTVKLADLRHNSDLTRLDEIDDKARNRIEKYTCSPIPVDFLCTNAEFYFSSVCPDLIQASTSLILNFHVRPTLTPGIPRFSIHDNAVSRVMPRYSEISFMEHQRSICSFPI